jgi:tight adherence protein B
VELTMPIAIFALVFIAMLALMNRRLGKPEGEQELLRRLRPHSDALDLERRRRPQESKLGHALLRRINLLRKLEQYMWQAGLYWRVSEILITEVVLLGLGIAAGMVVMNDMLLAAGCGVALATLPLLYVGFRRKRRLKAFARQLPHALDLVKSTMEAGHSLPRAFHVVVGEFPDPIAGELRTVLEQARLGVPMVRALDDMLARVPHEDLRLRFPPSRCRPRSAAVWPTSSAACQKLSAPASACISRSAHSPPRLAWVAWWWACCRSRC